MKDIFVSKEIAQELKKIDFNESCIAYYQDYEGFNNLYVSNFETDESVSTLTNAILVGNHSTDEDCISAPTWEQVFKWFREKMFDMIIKRNAYKTSYFFKIYKPMEETVIYSRIKESDFYPTYEECRNALILQLIELQQKQIKNELQLH